MTGQVNTEENASLRITHGRHCTCSSCAREDWTNPDLAPCGMHGEDCPALYQPLGRPGEVVQSVAGEQPTRWCCVTCGAVITEGTTAMHNRWHDQLDAAIAANRPDPRSAFIGG